MNKRIEKKHRKQREAREWKFIELFSSLSPEKNYAFTALLEGMVNKTLDFNYKDLKAGQAFLKAKVQEFAATSQSN